MNFPAVQTDTHRAISLYSDKHVEAARIILEHDDLPDLFDYVVDEPTEHRPGGRWIQVWAWVPDEACDD